MDPMTGHRQMIDESYFITIQLLFIAIMDQFLSRSRKRIV